MRGALLLPHVLPSLPTVDLAARQAHLTAVYDNTLIELAMRKLLPVDPLERAVCGVRVQRARVHVHV